MLARQSIWVLDMKSLTLTHLEFGWVPKTTTSIELRLVLALKKFIEFGWRSLPREQLNHLDGIGAQQQVQNLNGADPY